MQGNRSSSLGMGEVLWFYSSCGGNLVYILELQWGWLFKTRICSVITGLLSSYEGHLRNLHEAWQGNTDTSSGEGGDGLSLSSWHRDIGILINFQEESRLVSF